MRYFLGFLIAVGLVILVVILVLKGSTNTIQPQIKPLVSYANSDAVVSMTIAGPIVADQNYQEVQVNISQSSSQINIIRGYNGSVVNTQSFINNESAFVAFLSALSHYGFNLGNSNYAYKSSIGFCSFGSRYMYGITNDGNTIQNYWTSSCGGEGNFKGDAVAINDLFRSQIPTYSTITNDVSI